MNNQNFKALERSSTLFLKLILLVLSIGVLVFCGFLLYQITQSDALGYYRPILIGVVISTIPLLYIFYQAFHLLDNIDKNLSLDEIINKYKLYLESNDEENFKWQKKYIVVEYYEYPEIIKRCIELNLLKGIDNINDLKYLKKI